MNPQNNENSKKFLAVYFFSRQTKRQKGSKNEKRNEHSREKTGDSRVGFPSDMMIREELSTDICTQKICPSLKKGF